MKKLIWLLATVWVSTLSAQMKYQVNVLDSIVTTAGSQGVYGMVAESYNGAIHLAYISGSTNNEWHLVYEVRDNGQRLSRELVHKYPSSPWLDPETVIQFDADGQPHIYCAQIARGETYITHAGRVNGSWVVERIDYHHMGNFLNANKDGGHQLGFVSRLKGGIGNEFQPIIHYFHHLNGAWQQTTVSNSPFNKSEPAVFHHGEDIYVAYSEFHAPDSSIFFIHKWDNGSWDLNYKKVYAPGTAWNTFGGQWVQFGAYGSQLHVLHTVENEQYSQPLSHLVLTGSGWEEYPIDNREEYIYFASNCNNIEFDQEGSLYLVARDIVAGIDHEDTYFEFRTPREGPFYGYYDLVIQDGFVYLYFIGGNKAPGTANMFYEAIGKITDLTSVHDIQIQGLQELGVYPNPGRRLFQVSMMSQEEVTLSVHWMDEQGRLIGGVEEWSVNTGENIFDIALPVAQAGQYFLRITDGHGIKLIPVIQY